MFWRAQSLEQRIGALVELRREFEGGPLRLSRDFHELLECFARHNVRYLVVGGLRIR